MKDLSYKIGHIWIVIYKIRLIFIRNRYLKNKKRETHKMVIINKLDEFNRILGDLKQFVEKDVHKAKKLYVKARNLYMEFEAEERQKVYGELMGLYDKLNHLIKEEEAQRERLAKEKAQKFLRRIGFYKTPEEKQRIALQKEREKQEKLRKIEKSKRQKEQEAKSKEEEKPVQEKRRGIFERLFGKSKIAEEEKPPVQEKPIGEVEELEEAIRNLGLFKKTEKAYVKEPKEILELPKEENPIGKPQKQKEKRAKKLKLKKIR